MCIFKIYDNSTRYNHDQDTNLVSLSPFLLIFDGFKFDPTRSPKNSGSQLHLEPKMSPSGAPLQ